VASTVAAWVALSLLVGLGTAASATVATLFVVDLAPEQEWDPRIAWFQSFNGAGQVCGLMLARIFGSAHIAAGLLVATAFATLALLVGRIGLPTDLAQAAQTNLLAECRLHDLISAIGSEQMTGGPLRHSHHLYRAAFRLLPRIVGHGFARFLSSWFAYNFGVAAFFAYYPLLMQRSFDVAPRATALVYAATAAVGIGLFVLAGHEAARRGSGSVYVAGLSLRIAGFVMLGFALLAEPHSRSIPAISGFVFVMLAWPVLSVSGTGLAARLTAVGEGAAMGLMNAVGALATVLGTFVGGPLVQWTGYNVVVVFSLAGLAAALALGWGVMRQSMSKA
jgi:hypothetical protein